MIPANSIPYHYLDASISKALTVFKENFCQKSRINLVSLQNQGDSFRIDSNNKRSRGMALQEQQVDEVCKGGGNSII